MQRAVPTKGETVYRLPENIPLERGGWLYSSLKVFAPSISKS